MSSRDPENSDDILLRQMKSKMASMEAAVKDRLDLIHSWQSGATEPSVMKDIIMDNSHGVKREHLDGGGKLEFRTNLPEACLRTMQHTPQRQELPTSHRSANRNVGASFNLNMTSDHERKPSEISIAKDVMAKEDLTKLKARLRKALQVKDEPMAIKQSFPVKPADITNFKTELVRTYDLFQTGASERPITTPKTCVKTTTAKNPQGGGHNASLMIERSRNASRLECSENEKERDRSVSNRVDSINRLERKIMQLKTENSAIFENQDRRLLKTTPNRYASKDSRDLGTPRKLFDSGIKTNISALLQPASSVKIPAYLAATRIVDHDPRTSLHRCESLNVQLKNSSMSKRETRRERGQGSITKQRIDKLYDSFLKNKNYWDDMFHKRKIDRHYTARPFC